MRITAWVADGFFGGVELDAVACGVSWKLLTDPIPIRPGDQLRVDDGPAFVVQKVVSHKRLRTEVITTDGFPMVILGADYVAIWVEDKK